MSTGTNTCVLWLNAQSSQRRDGEPVRMKHRKWVKMCFDPIWSHRVSGTGVKRSFKAHVHPRVPHWPCRLIRWTWDLASVCCRLAFATTSSPLSPTARCVANPSCPGARTEQQPAGMAGGVWLCWLRAALPWLRGRTVAKDGGFCVSDWWQQDGSVVSQDRRPAAISWYPALAAACPSSSPYLPYRNS